MLGKHTSRVFLLFLVKTTRMWGEPFRRRSRRSTGRPSAMLRGNNCQGWRIRIMVTRIMADPDHYDADHADSDHCDADHGRFGSGWCWSWQIRILVMLIMVIRILVMLIMVIRIMVMRIMADPDHGDAYPSLSYKSAIVSIWWNSFFWSWQLTRFLQIISFVNWIPSTLLVNRLKQSRLRKDIPVLDC